MSTKNRSNTFPLFTDNNYNNGTIRIIAMVETESSESITDTNSQLNSHKKITEPTENLLTETYLCSLEFKCKGNCRLDKSSNSWRILSKLWIIKTMFK